MTRGPLWRLLAASRPVRAELALAAVASALTVGCGVAVLALSGYVIARASEHPPVLALSVAVVGVRAFGVGRGLLRYVERISSHDAAFRALAGLRVAVFGRLERLLPGMPEARSGDLASRLVSDVDAAQDLYVRVLLPPAAAVLVGAGAVSAVLALLAPAGAVLAAGLVVAGGLVPWLATRLDRSASARTAEARGCLAAQLGDTLQGADDLIANGAVDNALRELDATDAALTAAARRSALASAVSTGATQAAVGATVAAVLLLAVHAAAGGMGPVPVAVAVLTCLAAFEATAPLVAAAQSVGGVRASGQRLVAVMDAPGTLRATAQEADLPDGPGHVVARGLRLRYTPDGPEALCGVDIDLAPGSRVAVVGPSGSGKSTLAQLVMRMRDPDGGILTLDGVPYDQIDDDAVRTRVTGCLAKPHVFDSNVAENLRLARPGADLSLMREAVRAARLLDWIEALPLGWDTPVGANGSALSGGERQRLALARAILRDPDVLVLDEPTASLDPSARRELTRDLLDATRGRTTLLITHDLDGLDEVDEVIVLDGGRIVEAGPPLELLARGGRFRDMRDRQLVLV